jgi:hypothetical protein
LAPADVGADALASTAPRAESGLLKSGNGCGGYAFGFRNWLTSPSYNASLGLSTTKPLVYITDSNSGGPVSNGLVVGQAAVAATEALTSTHSASAIANAKTATVRVLPTANYPDGIVQVTLTNASISCRSGAAVTAAYDLTVQYPGGSKTISYVTGGSVVPSLPNPATIPVLVGTVTHALSEYLQWDVSLGPNQEQNGASSIDHVFGLSVPESVAGNGGFGVQLGALSCVAADNR